MGDIILLALVAGIENSREGGGGEGAGVRDNAIVELLRTERILLFYAE